MNTTAPSLPLLGTQAGFRRFSVAEYHRLTESGFLTEDDNLELLEGYLVLKMARNPPHDGTIQRAHKRILRVLPAGWDMRIQSAVTLPDSEPEPDLAVARDDPAGYVTRHPHVPDIGLLIEVSDSTLAGDRADKGRIFARAGISTYWIINLVDRQIEAYTQPSGPSAAPGYGQRRDSGIGDAVELTLDTHVIATIPVRELLP